MSSTADQERPSGGPAVSTSQTILPQRQRRSSLVDAATVDAATGASSTVSSGTAALASPWISSGDPSGVGVGGSRTRHNPHESSFLPLSSIVGNAVILLSNWDKYRLSERLCYHFDLTQALSLGTMTTTTTTTISTSTTTTTTTTSGGGGGDQPDDSCRHPVAGVVALLECVPRDGRLRTDQRRKLKNDMRIFNAAATALRREHTTMSSSSSCYQPPRLPLRINPSSNVFFAYEYTRMAFIIDASPTLTSSYGMPGTVDPEWKATAAPASSSSSSPYAHCYCPLDRILPMTKTFFHAMAQPIRVPGALAQGYWQPALTVTILAVFPRTTSARVHHRGAGAAPGGTATTRLLVRDVHIRDAASVDQLMPQFQEWIHGEVETELARRLSEPVTAFDSGTMPLYASTLRDFFEAGDLALNTLSSTARPIVVVATDGRSMACDAVIDIVSEADRVDIPLVVLDLSSPQSHATMSSTDHGGGGGGGGAGGLLLSSQQDFQRSFLEDFRSINYDPLGALFPLHLSDDSEHLFAVCKATGGCFFDATLLEEAARTSAGHVPPESPLSADHYFSSKRHTIRPNAVQWYTLFYLSPLSPRTHSNLGKLPAPDYIQRKLHKLDVLAPVLREQQQQQQQHAMGGRIPVDRKAPNNSISSSMTTLPTAPHQSSSTAAKLDRQMSVSSDPNAVRRGASGGAPSATTADMMIAGGAGVGSVKKVQPTRITFSTYIVNPIRIKALLLMRVKEGLRTKQYGSSTNDPDKVFIQLALSLDLGNVLYYELSYKALPGHNHMVGFAHVKIELSGDPTFLQTVKNDFLNQGNRARPVTMAQQVSLRLCKLLTWIRKEDMLQSYLSPLKWSDQLSSPDTPFVKRLGTLTQIQRRRHFRIDEFECICRGKMPYEHDDDDFLSQFRGIDDGEQEMIEALEEWSTQVIKDRRRYVKETPCSQGGLASYCVVEVSRSHYASRLFSVSVETFAGADAGDRLMLLSSLKTLLHSLRDVKVMPKQMGPFLFGVAARNSDELILGHDRLVHNQHNYESWDLVKDPEIFPLLVKRRAEIGGFSLLDAGDDHALLAKLVFSAERQNQEQQDPGVLVQYHIAVLDDRVVVDLHMESESGRFFPFRTQASGRCDSIFQTMVRSLKKRDQECAHALRCRTTLLRVFDDEGGDQKADTQLACVEKLLAYASNVSVRLRFFHSGSGSANEALRALTEEMLLASTFGAKVAKLSIDTQAKIQNLESGDWFLVEFDKDTMSLAHMSVVEKSEVEPTRGRGIAHRELTFFTLGTSDLYSRRDDVGDDYVSAGDDHISEHLCVTEFSDLVLEAHKQNYSYAAYIALTNETTVPFDCFHLDDFAEALGTLEFVEVATVLIAGDSGTEIEARAKLWDTIATVLQPIDDESFVLFYRRDNRSQEYIPPLDDDISSSARSASESTGAIDDEVTRESGGGDREDSLDDDSLDGKESEAAGYVAPNPIFCMFLLDGQPASIHDLASIERSTNLSVLLSVFNGTGKRQERFRKFDTANLSKTQIDVSFEIVGLLNAFVAEQTLERLRYLGGVVDEQNLRLAKVSMLSLFYIAAE